jgi:hypothetical protein
MRRPGEWIQNLAKKKPTRGMRRVGFPETVWLLPTPWRPHTTTGAGAAEGHWRRTGYLCRGTMSKPGTLADPGRAGGDIRSTQHMGRPPKNPSGLKPPQDRGGEYRMARLKPRPNKAGLRVSGRRRRRRQCNCGRRPWLGRGPCRRPAPLRWRSSCCGDCRPGRC